MSQDTRLTEALKELEALRASEANARCEIDAFASLVEALAMAETPNDTLQTRVGHSRPTFCLISRPQETGRTSDRSHPEQNSGKRPQASACEHPKIPPNSIERIPPTDPPENQASPCLARLKGAGFCGILL